MANPAHAPTSAPIDPTRVTSVTAPVAFLNNEWKGRDELARIYDRATRHANTTKIALEILNGRLPQEAGELDLDTNGFILAHHQAQFSNFEDRTGITTEYFAEMAEYMRQLTGAVKTVAFPFYQLRLRKPLNFFDAYSLYFHFDFAERLWPGMSQRTVREADIGDYPAEEYDFALYTLWRPLYDTIEQDPLVVGDASSIDRSDVLEYRLAKEGKESLAEIPVHADGQRYYYFPRMRPDEVLIFKQQDSRDGVAKFCPHTSFVDPNSPENPVERRSIDMRVMCIFPKGETPQP